MSGVDDEQVDDDGNLSETIDSGGDDDGVAGGESDDDDGGDDDAAVGGESDVEEEQESEESAVGGESSNGEGRSDNGNQRTPARRKIFTEGEGEMSEELTPISELSEEMKRLGSRRAAGHYELRPPRPLAIPTLPGMEELVNAISERVISGEFYHSRMATASLSVRHWPLADLAGQFELSGQQFALLRTRDSNTNDVLVVQLGLDNVGSFRTPSSIRRKPRKKTETPGKPSTLLRKRLAESLTESPAKRASESSVEEGQTAGTSGLGTTASSSISEAEEREILGDD